MTHPAAPPRRFRHARKVISLSMLIMGACGIIYEYTLGVLGNNLMGSSHEQIFVIIGIMMFAMGIGATLQQRLKGRLLDTFVAIEVLLGLLGGIATLAVYASFVWTASYQVVLFGFAFVIGALIGLEIPVAIRINTEYQKVLRINLADVLSMDYVGALIGALLFAYVLLTRVSIGRIGVSLGLVNTLLAAGVLAYFWPLVHRKRTLAAACVVSVAALGTCFLRTDAWMARLEQRCFEDPIVHSETTPYQHLVVTRRPADGAVRFYINGHLQFASEDEKIYHELLVHPAMTLAPRRVRVLILGGGDGLALREVLRYEDVDRVTLVDIDPAVTRLAARHPDFIRLNEGAFEDARVERREARGVLPGEPATVRRPTKLASRLLDRTEYELAEVQLVHIDADLFVRDIGEAFDVAILDFPDPKVLEVAKLYSVEFYRALTRRLAPGGLVAVQSSSPYHARAVFLAIGRTLEAAGFHALPYHEHVPTFGEWGWHLAWLDGATPGEMRTRLAELARVPVETAFLTPDVLRAAFVFGKGWLEPQEDLRPNTKMRPVLVQYYRESWR